MAVKIGGATKKVFDSAIRAQVNLLRYEEGLSQRVARILTKAQSEVVGAIAAKDPTLNKPTPWKKRRLRQLNKDIGDILNTRYADVKNLSKGELRKLAGYSAQNMASTYNSAIGADLLQVKLTRQNLRAIADQSLVDGKVIGKWWDGQKKAIKEKLSETMNKASLSLQAGKVQGESVGKLIGRIRGTATQKGIMKISRDKADALVRTSVMQVANDTRLKVLSGNEDVMEGYEMLATLDVRTTPLCQAYDTKRYTLQFEPIGHAMPFDGGPPYHWRCRTTFIPITLPWKKLMGKKSKLSKKQITQLEKMEPKQRAAMGGPVRASMNYNQWLKTQPLAVQQEVLGIRRQEIWSRYGLSSTDLIHQSGRPLTIIELENKVLGTVDYALTSFSEINAAAINTSGDGLISWVNMGDKAYNIDDPKQLKAFLSNRHHRLKGAKIRVDKRKAKGLEWDHKGVLTKSQYDAYNSLEGAGKAWWDDYLWGQKTKPKLKKLLWNKADDGTYFNSVYNVEIFESIAPTSGKKQFLIFDTVTDDAVKVITGSFEEAAIWVDKNKSLFQESKKQIVKPKGISKPKAPPKAAPKKKVAKPEPEPKAAPKKAPGVKTTKATGDDYKFPIDKPIPPDVSPTAVGNWMAQNIQYMSSADAAIWNKRVSAYYSNRKTRIKALKLSFDKGLNGTPKQWGVFRTMSTDEYLYWQKVSGGTYDDLVKAQLPDFGKIGSTTIKPPKVKVSTGFKTRADLDAELNWPKSKGSLTTAAQDARLAAVEEKYGNRIILSGYTDAKTVDDAIAGVEAFVNRMESVYKGKGSYFGQYGKKQPPIRLEYRTKLSSKGASGIYTHYVNGKDYIRIATKNQSPLIDTTGSIIGNFNLSSRIQGIVTHEVGHSHWYNLADKKFRATFENMFKAMGDDLVSNNVSKYAATNHKELFAEMFSAWKNPSYSHWGKQLPKQLDMIMAYADVGKFTQATNVAKKYTVWLNQQAAKAAKKATAAAKKQAAKRLKKAAPIPKGPIKFRKAANRKLYVNEKKRIKKHIEDKINRFGYQPKRTDIEALFRTYHENYVSSNIKHSLSSWQSSTRNTKAQALKIKAEWMERRNITTRISQKGGSEQLDEAYKYAKTISDEEYVKMRAMSQVYLEMTGQDTILMHRGISGGHGEAYRDQLRNLKRGLSENLKSTSRYINADARARNVMLDKLYAQVEVLIEEDAITGWSSSLGVARKFGKNSSGVTLTRRVPRQEIIIHDKIWKKGSYLGEKETIMIGGNFKMPLNKVDFNF